MSYRSADVVPNEVVVVDQVVVVLVDPNSVGVVGGVVAVDHVVPASPDQLKPVEAPADRVPGEDVVAAVLLETYADAETVNDLVSSVVLRNVVEDCVVARSRDSDGIVAVIHPITADISEGRIPQNYAFLVA